MFSSSARTDTPYDYTLLPSYEEANKDKINARFRKNALRSLLTTSQVFAGNLILYLWMSALEKSTTTTTITTTFSSSTTTATAAAAIAATGLQLPNTTVLYTTVGDATSLVTAQGDTAGNVHLLMLYTLAAFIAVADCIFMFACLCQVWSCIAFDYFFDSYLKIKAKESEDEDNRRNA